MGLNGRSAAVLPLGRDRWLRSFVDGERGRALRIQLASRHPNCSADEIEDSIQTACEHFLDEAAEGISAPGQIYAWIRTSAHRSLNREADHHDREVVVDPVEDGLLQALVADEPGPEDEVIAHEDDADLAQLAREVTASLSERRRQVLALYGAGYRRPEIAAQLGLTQRTVKRDLLEIMEEARGAVARLSGGGCERGEPLIVRLACGLASPAERTQAQLHLTRCARCEHFHGQLGLWREKAGALVPVPTTEQAVPELLERAAQKTLDGFGSLKQQLVDGGVQVKQHAANAYYRAVDPTPLAAARPGTAAAIVAGCITLGGGATYCVEQSVNPFRAAEGLIAPAREDKKAPQPSKAESEREPVVVAPVESPPVEPAPIDPTPTPTVQPTPAPTPEPAPAPPPPPPPPEQTFEPASPGYQAPAPEPAPAESPSPAPVSESGVPEFGGP